ncbi:uncharacterized protein LOC144258926 [Eretmochelys imbricata]
MQIPLPDAKGFEQQFAMSKVRLGQCYSGKTKLAALTDWLRYCTGQQVIGCISLCSEVGKGIKCILEFSAQLQDLRQLSLPAPYLKLQIILSASPPCCGHWRDAHWATNPAVACLGHSVLATVLGIPGWAQGCYLALLGPLLAADGLWRRRLARTCEFIGRPRRRRDLLDREVHNGATRPYSGEATAGDGEEPVPWKRYTKDFQPLPLDSPVHSLQLGDSVLVRTWKDEPLQEKWKGPQTVLLVSHTAAKVEGHKNWIHHSRLLLHQRNSGPSSPSPRHPPTILDSNYCLKRHKHGGEGYKGIYIMRSLIVGVICLVFPISLSKEGMDGNR